MSRILTRAQLTIRLLAPLFGLLLLVYLVHRAGAANLMHNLIKLGWGLALIIVLGGLSHVVKTWAWQLTLTSDKHRVSFFRMLSLRLASEAVGQLGILGQLFGDGLRVSALSNAMPIASRLASVTLDRAFFILTAIVVTTAGIFAALGLLPLAHALSIYATVLACVLVGLVTFTLIVIERRWTVFSGATDVLSRIPYLNRHLERKRSLICSVEDKLFAFYHQTPGLFSASFALNVACHLAAVLEVFFVLWLLGAKSSFVVALAMEALTKVVNTVGLLNPGNVGTYEGGNMLIAKLFGMSGAIGLTLAISRRIRAIFWTAVGVVCLALLSLSRKRIETRDNDHVSLPVIEDSAEIMANMLDTASPTAIILASNLRVGFSFGSLLPQVGALPVLLRAILRARKAGAGRIVVVVNSLSSSSIEDELNKTKRLLGCVEWFEVDSHNLSMAQLVQHVGCDQPVMLILAERTYHPTLFRRAAEAIQESAPLALVTGGRLVGIYALPRSVVSEVAKYCPADISSIEELHAWLSTIRSVQSEAVPEDQWQEILIPEQRLLAEQKLDRWLVKPTDGIFARFNRKVSIPISRQLIKFPITPNMVSLFTLGVSLAAGVYFALGGYWNMLTGAGLSWFASVLDGCDGEVARLKLQESAFGCWLETICDYLYYLFIFTGMTIGLWRSAGSRMYLIWGGLLLFGAVASFLTTGLQRHHLTSGRPEQYLGIWHQAADSRRSNLFLYLGRHTEFIIRRCFVPYVFLFFALFNIMSWLLVGATLGANLVWMIAFYSHLTFTRARASTIPSPA